MNLKRGSSRASVLLVPGAGGSALPFVWLARTYAGPEHVVGLEPAAPSIESIAALAASHLEAAEGSGGPWHLVGHDLGAAVAMEMAHQLERAGERVSTLVLLQPFLRLGGALDADERRQAGARQRATARLRAAGAAGDREDLACLGLDASVPRLGAEFAASLLARAEDALHAYVRHTVRPVSCPVHLLLTADLELDVAGTEPRLRELTGGVSRHELPGPAAEILRQPLVRSVAPTIASLVRGDRAPAASPPPRRGWT